MNLGQRTKDSADIRIYTINWARFLGALSTTISSSTFVVDSGLTKVSESNTTTSAAVKVSGGTSDQSYVVTNTIVTASGETKKVVFVVKVSDN